MVNFFIDAYIVKLQEKSKVHSIWIVLNYDNKKKGTCDNLLPNYHMKPVTIKQDEAYEILKDVFKSN